MVDAITVLPDPPSRQSQSNAAFVAAMDAWLAALQVFCDEMNTAIGQINDVAASAYVSTSTSSVSVGTGTKNFTVELDEAYSPGQWIIAARTSAPTTTYMRGQVTSYDGATGALVTSMAASAGSGTYTDWSIGLIPDPATIAAYLQLAGGTMTGLLIGTTPAAGASGYASIRLPHGAAPTTNLANGDKWTTTTGEFTRINGATKQTMHVDGTLTGYKETVYTITDGAAFEIDPANGTMQNIVLGASRTPKATNMQNGQSVLLAVDDGSAFTLTWTDTTFGASGVKWMDGSAPVLATSGLTWISLWKYGGQVYGSSPGASS